MGRVKRTVDSRNRQDLVIRSVLLEGYLPLKAIPGASLRDEVPGDPCHFKPTNRVHTSDHPEKQTTNMKSNFY